MFTAEQIADLIRRAATELAPDIAEALRASASREAAGSPAAHSLETLLANASCARERSVPACQDTGTPSFWFELPDGTPTLPIVEAVREGVLLATQAGHLRLNVLEALSGKQVSSNFAPGSPSIHFHFGPAETTRPRVTLLLKGGGSENQSRQYSLPDSTLGAGRDLEGVRRCLLDAVHRAQGAGCAPGILGVCIGGDRATGYAVAKEQLLRTLDDASPNADLAALEARVLEEANTLGIGPMGLGGKTTLLGVKIAERPRLPASFFVTVAYNCWACRRAVAVAAAEL